MNHSRSREEPDYYDLLQVSTKAEPGIIEVAYRRLARRYHPDINPGPHAHERMRELNTAVEILLDPLRRAEYDRRRLRLLAQKTMAEKPTMFIVPPVRAERPAARVPATLRRLRVGWLPIVGGLGVAVAVGAFMLAQSTPGDGGGAQSSEESSETAATAVAAASQAPATSDQEQPADTVSFSDGKWLVDEEIAPGIWRATPSESCSWQRLSSIDGQDDVIAAAGSYSRVEILASDAAFSSEGCGWWTQALTARSASPGNPFDDGTWLVGDEIEPGLWQNSEASPECTWTRLERLDGEDSPRNESGGRSIITVEITEDNRAFHSQGCGVWTRVGDSRG